MMKTNLVLIGLFLLVIIGYFWFEYPANQQEKMAVVVGQMNQATHEFVNAAKEIKKHFISEIFNDHLGDALNVYQGRLNALNAGGCPGDFKSALSNYKTCLAVYIASHKIHQRTSETLDLLKNAATGMDSVCRKYNIHFENLNTVNFN